MKETEMNSKSRHSNEWLVGFDL